MLVSSVLSLFIHLLASRLLFPYPYFPGLIYSFLFLPSAYISFREIFNVIFIFFFFDMLPLLLLKFSPSTFLLSFLTFRFSSCLPLHSALCLHFLFVFFSHYLRPFFLFLFAFLCIIVFPLLSPLYLKYLFCLFPSCMYTSRAEILRFVIFLLSSLFFFFFCEGCLFYGWTFFFCP